MTKKIIPAVLIIAFLMASVPTRSFANTATVAAEKHTALLLQIETLLKLIKALQAQLLLQKTAVSSPTVKVASKVTAHGTLKVESVKGPQIKLSGILFAPQSCTGKEPIEFVLDFGNETSKTYTLENCNNKNFAETLIYIPTQVPVVPELILRQVDESRNVWQNYVQARYLINLTNPFTPSIKVLDPVGSKG